jgi:predicted metalloprotease with PDZ domain
MMSWTRKSITVCIALLIPIFTCLAADVDLEYDVTINAATPHVAQVTLTYQINFEDVTNLDFRFTPVQGSLRSTAFEFCASATGYDEAGNPLASVYVRDQDVWRTVGAKNTVVVRYSVALIHGLAGRLSRLSDAPFFATDGVLVPGRLLFMYPTLRFGDQVRFRFHLPPEWKLHAPWSVSEKDNIWQANMPLEDMAQSFFYMGKQQGYSSDLGKGKVTILGAAPFKNLTCEKYEKWIINILQSQYKVFKQEPHSRILVLLSPKRENAGPGVVGTSLRNSIHLSIPHAIEEKEFVQGYGLRLTANMLFSQWTSGRLSATEGAGYNLFQAGLLDYSANLSMMRAGLMNEDGFLQYLSTNINEYYANPLYADVPILKGASHELESMGIALSVVGGRLAGVILDKEILTGSEMKTSLDDFWQAFFTQRTSKSNIIKDIWDPLFKDSDFSAHVSTAPLDLEKALKACGVTIVLSTLDQPFLGSYFDTNSSTPELKWVMPGPLKTAGFKTGDILTHYNGDALPDAQVLFHKLRKAHVGDVVKLRVRAPDGVIREAEATLGARPVRRLKMAYDLKSNQAKLWNALTRGAFKEYY